MSSAVNSIIRAATRQNGEPLNILLFTTSEEYESLLCKTNHNFFALNLRQERWRNDVALIPENYTEINKIKGNGITFDLILCLGRKKHLKECVVISKELHIPLVIVEQEYPDKYNNEKISGDINIFVTHEQAKSWGFKENEYTIINNAINQHLYSYNENKSKTILTAINSWKRKGNSHGFGIYWKLFHNIKLPIKIIGHNPGISKHIHWQDEIEEFNKASIYINPTLSVPQPTQVLKAMYTGAVVIALDNCEINKVITHKKTGLLVDEKYPEYLLKYAEIYIKNKEWFRTIGIRANKQILLNHSVEQFVSNWNQIFSQATNIVYKGTSRA